jgi:hypothetical protein
LGRPMDETYLFGIAQAYERARGFFSSVQS